MNEWMNEIKIFFFFFFKPSMLLNKFVANRTKSKNHVESFIWPSLSRYQNLSAFMHKILQQATETAIPTFWRKKQVNTVKNETLQHCTVSFLRRVDTKRSPGPRSRLQVFKRDVSVTSVWIWEHKKVKEG